MKSTLIICALPEELAAVEAVLNTKFETQVMSQQLGFSVRKFNKENNVFYTLLSGMGPINASARLTLALHHLQIDDVLLLGVAGGLTEKTSIGDLVISTAVYQHDYYSSLEAGDFRMRSGELILSQEQGHTHDPLICADQHLIERCFKTEIGNHQILKGIVASGSEFVGRGQRKTEIAKLYDGLLAVDMEACAVANICLQFKKPFVVAKTISDTLHTDGTIESDFLKFLKFASENAAEVVKQFTV
ncbi:MAG: 5'-methylthioadenosine/S-adenosylhomocysteine nucleosidase [Bacteriovoracaceae bacterium]